MTQEEIRKADEDMNRRMVDHHPEPPQHLPENLPRHNRQLHLKCPRCDSTNTKFCYYNNYSLSQPRYFCKTCRRYWTEGGTLRSVPVGGGCRKGKRAKTSAISTGSSSSDVNLDNPRLPPSINASTSSLLLGSSSGMIGPSRAKEMGNMTLSPMPASYYPSGGFFPSFTSMRSLGHPQPLISHQRPNFGALFGIGGSSSSSNSNMALIQGFNNNLPPPSMAQPQHNEQMFNHHVINSGHNIGEPKINNLEPYYLYPNGHVNIGSSWNQNLVINNSNNSSNNHATTDSGAYVMNPNQWLDHDLHRFNGPPPGF